MKFTRIAASVSLLVLSAAAVSAEPGEDIGSAITVQNLVTAAFEKDKRNLSVGAGVRQQELIEVATDGLGELKFKDETKLALGPGAKMLLDKFVYDSATSTGSIVMNMTKGAFRFVTGVAKKPTYMIKTPTASITVRGTIFDLFVLQDTGETWLLLHEGGIEICNTNNVCRLHTEIGKLIRVTGAGGVGIPVKWSGFPGNGTPFDSAFPFVVTPPTFDPNPVFTREALLEPIVIPPKKKATVEEPKEESTEPVIKKKRKVVKVDDDDDNDEPTIIIKKKKRVVKTDDGDNDKPPRPIRVTKSKGPKYQEEPGMSGMDIVIGVGIGSFGRGSKGGGHKPPSRSMGNYAR